MAFKNKKQTTQNPKSTLNQKSFQAHILFFKYFQGQKNI
jgi:hypothetical protein